MREIVNIVKFIRSHRLNHREFQPFLSKMEAEVRWLSRGKVLKSL
jgi:hypothetical protein